MSTYTKRFAMGFACAAMIASSCSQQRQEVIVLKQYPINTMQGILTTADVHFDPSNSSDGSGALKITAESSRTVRLYETGDIDIENARLIYSAKIRAENLEGQAYIEMWCQFDGKGEFYSRALQSTITGSTGWVSQETPFFLKPGENPDNIRLNVVINGKGTIWIDDVRLTKGPLR